MNDIEEYVRPKRCREDDSGFRRKQQKLAGYDNIDPRKPTKQKSKRTFELTENYW